jgi:hypothetical protein
VRPPVEEIDDAPLIPPLPRPLTPPDEDWPATFFTRSEPSIFVPGFGSRAQAATATKDRSVAHTAWRSGNGFGAGRCTTPH